MADPINMTVEVAVIKEKMSHLERNWVKNTENIDSIITKLNVIENIMQNRNKDLEEYDERIKEVEETVHSAKAIIGFLAVIGVPVFSAIGWVLTHFFPNLLNLFK